MADAADPNAAAAAAPLAEPLLTVENLEAGYGEVQVLWGVSLRARRGALTAIVGTQSSDMNLGVVRIRDDATLTLTALP